MDVFRRVVCYDVEFHKGLFLDRFYFLSFSMIYVYAGGTNDICKE